MAPGALFAHLGVRLAVERTRALVAVDIDSEIVALAELNMQLDTLGIEIHLGDAYAWIAKCKERFDVVIDDVYLAGRDDVFRPGKSDSNQITALKRLLAPGGVLLANLVNGPGHRSMQIRTRAAFREGFPVVRSVTTPEKPSVAMNANARVTPPNWARTPATEVTVRRRRLVCGAVTTR